MDNFPHVGSSSPAINKPKTNMRFFVLLVAPFRNSHLTLTPMSEMRTKSLVIGKKSQTWNTCGSVATRYYVFVLKRFSFMLLVLCSFPIEHLGNTTHIMWSGGRVKDVY